MGGDALQLSLVAIPAFSCETYLLAALPKTKEGCMEAFELVLDLPLIMSGIKFLVSTSYSYILICSAYVFSEVVKGCFHSGAWHNCSSRINI